VRSVFEFTAGLVPIYNILFLFPGNGASKSVRIIKSRLDRHYRWSGFLTDVGFMAPPPKFSPKNGGLGGMAMTVEVWKVLLSSIGDRYKEKANVDLQEMISNLVGQMGARGFK
jgi:hypothetical protein